MSSSKDLAKFTIEELGEFFNSFDHVICDCDGVVFLLFKLLDGVNESIVALKELGKSVVYVTNNSGISREVMAAKMSKQGMPTEADDIVNPSRAIVDYLNYIKFDKKLYVIGSAGMKRDFNAAGHMVVNDNKPEVFGSIEEASEMKAMLHLDKDVGAVVVCLDLNTTFGSLNRAYRYISKNPDTIYIATGYNQTITVFPDELCLGPAYFQDMLKEATGKAPVHLGKPSREFGKYVDSKLGYDPKKTLFIGDSLEHDVAFANRLGYHTLLVLSGASTLEDMKSCPEEWKPDYHVGGLADIKGLIKKATT